MATLIATPIRALTPPAAVLTVYLAALLQGLTLVSFPASSAVLKTAHGFNDAQYGAIFLPQVAAAVVAAIAGAAAAGRLGLRRLLILALAANLVSQLLLAFSLALAPQAAYLAVLAGTACLGLGFGLGGAPLNSYPPALFPSKPGSAVVALHTAMGVGLSLGPLAVSVLAGARVWVAFPLGLAAIAATLIALSVTAPLPEASTQKRGPSSTEKPARERAFWLFLTIAVLYAFAEGTFSNWAVIYLKEAKHLPADVAALALSVFWGALVAGRLAVAVLVLTLPAAVVWMALPPLMIVAFLALPYAAGATSGIALFALAGVACSAFFPLSIALASKRFPAHVAWVSSMLTAALMLGVGLGSFAIGASSMWLPLDSLYRWSSLYPFAALLLMVALRAEGRRRGSP